MYTVSECILITLILFDLFYTLYLKTMIHYNILLTTSNAEHLKCRWYKKH